MTWTGHPTHPEEWRDDAAWACLVPESDKWTNFSERCDGCYMAAVALAARKPKVLVVDYSIGDADLPLIESMELSHASRRAQGLWTVKASA